MLLLLSNHIYHSLLLYTVSFFQPMELYSISEMPEQIRYSQKYCSVTTGQMGDRDEIVLKWYFRRPTKHYSAKVNANGGSRIFVWQMIYMLIRCGRCGWYGQFISKVRINTYPQWPYRANVTISNIIPLPRQNYFKLHWLDPAWISINCI